jgi:cytochrome b561
MRYICPLCGRVVDSGGTIAELAVGRALIGCGRQDCPLKTAMKQDQRKLTKILFWVLVVCAIVIVVAILSDKHH